MIWPYPIFGLRESVSESLSEPVSGFLTMTHQITQNNVLKLDIYIVYCSYEKSYKLRTASTAYILRTGPLIPGI